jgi:hypothetical protein
LDSITEEELDTDETIDPTSDDPQSDLAPAPTIVVHGSALSTLSEEEQVGINDDESATLGTVGEATDLEDEPETPVTPSDTPANPSPPRYNLRPVRDRSDAHRLDHEMDMPENAKAYTAPIQLTQKYIEKVLTAYILTQMSASKGIKLYGKPAVEAVFKEFCQLHDKDVFVPQIAESLTSAQKRAALWAISLIKKKKLGTFTVRVQLKTHLLQCTGE